MGHPFSILPPWQAVILAVVFTAAGAALAAKVLKPLLRKDVVEEIAAQAIYIGRELRKYGYLHRGNLVEGAARTVRAYTRGEAIPELVKHDRDRGAPILEGFIRALRGNGRRTKPTDRKVALRVRSSAREEVSL